MEHFVGLDVSQEVTHVCVVGGSGEIVWQGTCFSTPESIASVIKTKARKVVRIGLESGMLLTWHWHALNDMGMPVVCLDARHAKAALSMQMNKTDKNDAHGLAQIMRTGWYREVGVKSLDSHEVRAMLGARYQLVGMRTDLRNQIRGILKTFSLLGEVLVQPGSRFRCCETLFEMPETVGSLHAGTLVYAASYLSGNSPAIEIYTSTDEGQHWVYSSTPVAGAGEKGHGGLWEPQFSVARDGGLVMFWSDETFLCCSQKLEKIRTFDGVTWKDQSDVVASTVEADRPGMIVVNWMPTSLYFMTYEICGDPATGHKCAAYYRTSRDGWDYGRAADMGKRIETADGNFFEHAPTNIWSPSPLSANGVIVVVGQVLMNADHSVAAQNGRVLFVNPLLDGSGPWSMISAPVEVPNSYDNYCPNYSSALLPVRNGSALLEFASDYRAVNECGMYFSTKEWTAMDAVKPAEAQKH